MVGTIEEEGVALVGGRAGGCGVGFEVGLGEGYTERRVCREVQFDVAFSPVSVMY